MLPFIQMLCVFCRRKKLMGMVVVVCIMLLRYVCFFSPKTLSLNIIYMTDVRIVTAISIILLELTNCLTDWLTDWHCHCTFLSSSPVEVWHCHTGRVNWCLTVSSTYRPRCLQCIQPDCISTYPPFSSIAPVSCDAFKNCLMRIPHTSECFGNINAFFKENGISSPKIPSMPKLPTQFSDVTKYLPTLPPELHQELSQIRLTQVPRNIAQTLTELLPKSSEGSVGPSLSSISQNFSNIPQKLLQFPSRTQQYFLNVRNRLNSLMPQDA